jgi:hypothetical protein
MALRPTKGMLTGSKETKTLPGESGPFDPNAGTPTSFDDEVPSGNGTTDNTGASRLEDTTGIWQAIFTQMGRVDLLETGGELLEILAETTRAGQPGAPIDESQLRTLTQEQREAALEAYLIFNQSFDRAQEIVDTLINNPEELEGMENPGEVTNLLIEQNALGLLGPSAATPVTSVPEGMVIRSGAGVTVDISEIGSISDVNLETIFEHLKGYIPGVSLPSWLPSAGVIFIPDIQGKIRQVNDAVGGVVDSIGGVLTGEASVQDVLDAMGGVITDVFDAVVYNTSEEGEEGILENAVSSVFGAIKDVLEGTADATTTGTVVGGVITSVLGSSLPTWLPGVLTTVFGSGSPVLPTIQRVLSEVGIDLPLTEVETEQDPTLMFTNRGNNYFVSSEGDEYFQLAESEDFDFEFNGQYTREQLENTGLETINSGTYQSLLDDLSFHALEEDIYQYSIEDLVARYEEEGGILPGDWKEMDEESRYNYFLDDYFDIPRRIEDPDKDPDEEPPVEPPVEPEPEPEPPVEPPPTDQPEPEPEPPTEEPEPDPTDTSVIEGLFADFLAQLDEEFTGQQEQINQIIQNFVETLPDFDAMPTMEDIAEYFEINGVTLSEQNFDRIRQELADAGYLTQEQLTEALAGVATPEQVQEAIEGAGFATPEQVIQALAEAGYATPDDITNALANSGFVTEDRMLQALAEAGYATPEQVEQIVNNAISGIVIPEGATAEEVRQLIQEAIDGIPEGISLEDVGNVVNEAIANIEFPEGLSEGDVRGIVDSFGFATSADVQAGFDDLNDKIDNVLNGVATQFTEQEAAFAADLLGLETSVFQQLAATEGALRDELLGLGEDLDSIRADFSGRFDEFADTFALFQTDVSGQFADLNQRFDDAINGIATQFSDQEAEFLASITGLEASIIQSLAAVEGGLSAELEMLGTDLISLQEDVAGRFDEFESFTSEQFELAATERQQLQQAIIAANGDITQLSADMQQMFADFGGTISDLFAGVGVDIEALQAGQITQQEALDQLRTSIGQQFTTAQEERQELQQAIIAVGGDVTQLSDDMMLRFQQQDQSIEELFAGTNVNIEALRQGQITQQEAFDAYQQYTTEQFGQAQQDRLALAQEIISVGGQVEALSADSQQRFAELGLSLADLQEEFNVNLVGLQQGQISQAEAFGQFRDSVTTRLGLAEEEREEILTRQADFERVYGEEQQALQEQITTGNLLTMLAGGGMFGGAAAPARAPYKEFTKGITYRPREAPELAIKTPAIDYNEEAQKLLMRTRRRGMLV